MTEDAGQDMAGAGLGDACLWELGRQEALKVQKTHDVRRVAVTDPSDDPDQLFPAYKGAGRRPVRYALLRKLNFRPSETSHIVRFLHLWASASARVLLRDSALLNSLYVRSRLVTPSRARKT